MQSLPFYYTTKRNTNYNYIHTISTVFADNFTSNIKFNN